MDLGLQDQIALVLASSKGLGLACARIFYQEGANVIISSRSQDNLLKAKKEIESLGSENPNARVHYFIADLNNERDIQNLVDNTLTTFNRIDILVHNAGGPPSAPVFQVTKDEWNDSINLNLLSFIKISRLVLPIMQKQRFGRIIAITSVSVKQPLENLVLSNTARLGVVGYAKTLANEYAKDNILVNVVCPGPNLTDRMKELIKSQMKTTGKSEEEIMKTWISSIPLGRLGEPAELANLVVFLCSKKASYITGTTIQVDGGFVKSPF
jgi:3-oxoacyl-[acyl-carrier protein] reductase